MFSEALMIATLRSDVKSPELKSQWNQPIFLTYYLLVSFKMPLPYAKFTENVKQIPDYWTLYGIHPFQTIYKCDC